MTEENQKGSKKTPITLIAALGNPGIQYAPTRHNIAWQMIEYLSFFNELDWKEKFNADYAQFRNEDESIFFIKPMTFMNRSGISLAALMNFYRLEPEELLVIHDELELEFGVISFKKGGGLGGHNGLRSIAESLGTRDFNRLRLGISRPDHRDITSYVLGPFSQEEKPFLSLYFEETAKLLELCLTNGFDYVEKKFRKKKLIEF